MAISRPLQTRTAGLANFYLANPKKITVLSHAGEVMVPKEPAEVNLKERGNNNAIERFMRYISLSRKNSLFCGSHAGAERTALIYSLACSCRLNGVNTFEYFADILNRLAYISPNAPDEVYQELLPNNWSNK